MGGGERGRRGRDKKEEEIVEGKEEVGEVEGEKKKERGWRIRE